MLTFQQVMTTDFGLLTTAAAQWDAAAADFKTVEDRYKDSVQNITMGPWNGVSADVAQVNFAATRYEYAAAQTQAKAIASLLRDAHTQLVDLKKKVESARADAIAADMSVSDQGDVSYDTSKLTPAERNAYQHDPDAKAAVREQEQKWAQRIRDAVRAVDDADQGVKLALEAVVVDTLGGKDDATLGVGFNGRAQGDIEVYEAQYAEEVATRINGGDKLSAAELAELQRTFRDNAGKPEFSQTFLNGLGAKGLIEFSNRMNDQIHVKNPKNRTDFVALEKGLANTLASATRDTKSDFYKKWRSDMQKVGMERFNTSFTDLRLEKARGYQSLVTLMSQGEGYSKQFLHDLGDDIMKAEKNGTDIWVMKGDYSGKDTGWFANDPMDGLLGVMSHDPAASAAFLKDEGRMKHLMDRDWEVVLEAHEHGNSTHYSPSLDGDDRAGFAAALQAGATGIDPSDENGRFVKHSDDNVAVFKNSIKHLAEAGDEFPESLREPMAHVLVNHGSTVHDISSRIDMRDLPIKQDELFEVIKQVSKDQASYQALNYGINQALVSDVHAPDQKHPQESLIRAGRTIGFLEQARTDAVGPAETAGWDEKWMFDKAISYIPVASDDVQAGFDYVVEKWQNDEQKKLDEDHANEKLTAYTKRNEQLMALTDEWIKVHDKDGSKVEHQRTIEEASGSGESRAKAVGNSENK
ncbi:hypothetical protein [Streptomyces sp. CB03238]|uniref:hypothetical protein n=1 Tax=Streptomyces sp. CB03238 TaxID=1907777 RepID=UPI000A109155|nr:hypothetical protein [Streptomyces sp. CB03238]ORT54393.1 hypothetical protein BKD26_35585 [Streptomyces sp. CB03238]